MADNPRTTPGMPVALTIAGSDSSGGAGIQADLKTFAVLGVYGCSAVTAITAQNTTGVKRSLVLDADLIDAQINAVASDLEVDAVKTGMLATSAVIEAVAAAVKRHNLFPLVVDPVMVAKGGDALIDDAAIQTLTARLLPLATLVTPNRHEAVRLLGQPSPIEDIPAALTAARNICQRFGAKACVIKGIHRDNDDDGEAVDVFFDGKQGIELASDWRSTPHTHGSGCTFSAAIAAALAQGQPLSDALHTAKAVISEAIRQAAAMGKGHGPVNHLAYLKVGK